MPDFPHPERVLMDGGVINPNWSDSQDRRYPDCCRELLSGHGVKFDENGRSDKAQNANWNELRRRDEDEPVAE